MPFPNKKSKKIPTMLFPKIVVFMFHQKSSWSPNKNSIYIYIYIYIYLSIYIYLYLVGLPSKPQKQTPCATVHRPPKFSELPETARARGTPSDRKDTCVQQFNGLRWRWSQGSDFPEKSAGYTHQLYELLKEEK